MRKFVPFVFAFCIYLRESQSVGLVGKTVVFGAASESPRYVKFLNEGFSELTALTLCMRFASEDQREYSPFSYNTPAHDNELSLWYKVEDGHGVLSIYFHKDFAQFTVPLVTSMMKHVCLSWESSTGVVTFWLGGERTLQKVAHQGGHVQGGGTMLVGEDQDSVEGDFEPSQRFVGEMSEVNLWDHVLSANDIKAYSEGCHSPGGDIVDWNTVIHVVEDPASMVTIKNNPDCVI
ncbi:C-reactive protein-like [Scyliorhinus torazame]|uniref:C-reactive protein-like n=2 Tax=Scyliorhinus torazame TaxID=75743 RepID=UPI003B5C35CB